MHNLLCRKFAVGCRNSVNAADSKYSCCNILIVFLISLSWHFVYWMKCSCSSIGGIVLVFWSVLL